MERKESALRYFYENQDFMSSVVEGGIEGNRKGTFCLSFVDREGKPLQGLRVKAEQTNHEFRHGANIFMLDEFENQEKNDIYRKMFPEAFNLATLPFYWKDLEPEEGKPRFTKDSPRVYRRPTPDLCVEYCLANGIEPKAHCLNYESFLPKWMANASVYECKQKLEKRFRELAERYASVIPQWEVTNETFNGYDHPTSSFFEEDDFVEWSFRTADKYFPGNRLLINDWAVWDWAYTYRYNRSPYFMQIERTLRNGITHLDTIGMQYHSFFDQSVEKDVAPTRYNPVHLWRVMDLYARFGKNIQITEMTLPAYSAETADEEVQAELLENTYKTFFAHPAMDAIIYWNVVDGYAAFAPQGDMTAGENKYHGALLRHDLSEKPAWKTLKRLFRETWHSSLDVEGKGNSVRLRGFYGDYDLTVISGGKEYKTKVTLSKHRPDHMTITLR